MISVIVPVYKAESTLKACVESLIAQSHENIEIILVDDGSPDESGKLCIYVPNAKRAVVSGEHLRYEMSVPQYPTMPGGDRFLLTDNGGAPYNKMYFFLCFGEQTAKGDVWETTTQYRIENY